MPECFLNTKINQPRLLCRARLKRVPGYMSWESKGARRDTEPTTCRVLNAVYKFYKNGCQQHVLIDSHAQIVASMLRCCPNDYDLIMGLISQWDKSWTNKLRPTPRSSLIETQETGLRKVKHDVDHITHRVVISLKIWGLAPYVQYD